MSDYIFGDPSVSAMFPQLQQAAETDRQLHEEYAPELAMQGVYMTPVGVPLSFVDAYKAGQNGNWGEAAIDATAGLAGALGIGGALKGLKAGSAAAKATKAAKAAARTDAIRQYQQGNTVQRVLADAGRNAARVSKTGIENAYKGLYPKPYLPSYGNNLDELAKTGGLLPSGPAPDSWLARQISDVYPGPIPDLDTAMTAVGDTWTASPRLATMFPGGPATPEKTYLYGLGQMMKESSVPASNAYNFSTINRTNDRAAQALWRLRNGFGQ